MSRTCYVRELKGRICIVDEIRTPRSGDTILLDMSGFLEWGKICLLPTSIVTDEGMILHQDLLEDIRIVGVVTHEITTISEQESSPI